MYPSRQQIIELATKFHSKSDIAKHLRVSVSGLCRYINTLNFSKEELVFLPRVKTSAISKEVLLAALIKCNWHQTEVAIELNSSPSTINRLIDFYEIERVSRDTIELDDTFTILGVPIVNKLGLTDIYLKDLIKRIEEKIEVVDDKTWISKYSTTNGYPKIQIYTNGKNFSHKIHRLIYFMTKQILNTEQCLCHIDDNRLNVHPDNLFVGTRQENNIDKAKKFRTNSELCEADIHNIVYLYDVGGWIQEVIGEKYNISQAQVGRILRGESFKHIPRKIFKSTVLVRTDLGENNVNSKVSNLQVVEMRRLWDNIEASKGELSRKYYLDRKTISSILERKTWKHI